jgi:hypothetical protein
MKTTEQKQEQDNLTAGSYNAKEPRTSNSSSRSSSPER